MPYVVPQPPFYSNTEQLLYAVYQAVNEGELSAEGIESRLDTINTTLGYLRNDVQEKEATDILNALYTNGNPETGATVGAMLQDISTWTEDSRHFLENITENFLEDIVDASYQLFDIETGIQGVNGNLTTNRTVLNTIAGHLSAIRNEGIEVTQVENNSQSSVQRNVLDLALQLKPLFTPLSEGTYDKLTVRTIVFENGYWYVGLSALDIESSDTPYSEDAYCIVRINATRTEVMHAVKEEGNYGNLKFSDRLTLTYKL